MPISYTPSSTTWSLPDESDQALAAMIDAVNSATTRFRGAFFNFSLPELVQAVAQTHARGLDTRIILDESQEAGAGGTKAFHALMLAGYPPASVRIGTSPIKHAFMHRKNAVLDGQVVIGGSTNWSASAFLEANELTISHSPDLAAAIEHSFDLLWDWISQHEPIYQKTA
jgi:phosphatidylserine/phosphatidylglycerophosphate/cardiolipin synthase-like enzyme